MKSNKIRDLKDDQLQKELVDLKSELFNLRFNMAVNQLDNPSQIRKVRKDIARIKTIMRERELGINVKG